MVSKLPPAVLARLNSLKELEAGVQRVHGLVEQFATATHNPDQYLIPMQRAFSRLKMQLMGAGLDSMSQLCGSMEMTARRGLPPQTKTRILRDAVGSLRFQLEMELRSVKADAESAARQAAESDEAP